MADLLPHYKSRVPGYWTAPLGETLDSAGVPHSFSGNFPSGYNPSDGDDQSLDPVGGIAGPILAATEITSITEATAPAAAIYAPANCVPPADFAELTSINPTADPASSWTPGNFVILGDGSLAHWGNSGSNWVEGAAIAGP